MSPTKETKHSKLFVAYIIFLSLLEIVFISMAARDKNLFKLIPELVVFISLIGILYQKKWARILYFIVTAYLIIGTTLVSFTKHPAPDILVLSWAIYIIPYYELIKNKQHYLR